MSPNICFSRLARSTFCQRPIRFPPERCAFSPPRSPCGNPCVLETFQTYRALSVAVNPLPSQVFHLFSTAGRVRVVTGLCPVLITNSFSARPKTPSIPVRHYIRRTPKRKSIQKLKIAWRLCFSRKPFRELCPRMRTPERGQLEALLNLMPKATATTQQAA